VRTLKVFQKLLRKSDEDVMRVLAKVMAETLAAGTELIDVLGKELGVDCLRHWQPDDAFFALLNDREAVGAMLAEVIGDTVANAYLTAPGARRRRPSSAWR
jgi:ParB family chromosome partitioning protein